MRGRKTMTGEPTINECEMIEIELLNFEYAAKELVSMFPNAVCPRKRFMFFSRKFKRLLVANILILICAWAATCLIIFVAAHTAIPLDPG